MIDPKELRIGNYVKDTDGDIGDVMELREEFVWLKCTNVKSYYDNIYPIPLTPEVLQRCEGFELMEFAGMDAYGMPQMRRGSYDKEQILFVVKNPKDGKWDICIDNCKNEMRVNVCTVEYLHQFQNTVYAFTGEELKLQTPQLAGL